ncbi:MAG: PssE/Cps14G family polysaccharide biosynthesis glycosyltransferase [Bifidobacteriaceae bacterium]|uniref:PssE/Cps14G family polysaccharide biosynthesis glycosyltransferase n=1 Tax=Bifidobacterium pseudocatenulatum TaxID=28026 RepID=UPI001F0E4AC7|nr:PssE/Cps14G family polysaccharide biosynthesis glycosyltransferase [Bifidobacterium pseudocatenulatum]MCH4858961.1 glycosyltransferase [Bifidobacterium pseudocatenulatum]MDO5763345.1 PssE/Cps14G family polysaccharide biosynthesis glycosyltransferase [Bifidobacteriaceae bacterium]
MIFITLGSQKFQFDRLLKAVDELVADGAITEPVFAQSGYSDYQPKHYEFKQFLDRDEFTKRMGEADLVITHGGTGAIIGAVKKGKKVIAVPRLAKYGEHVDDHQLQLLKEFKQMDIICVCDDCSHLAQALDEVRHTEYKPFHSNTTTIIDSIDGFIHAEVMGEKPAGKSDGRGGLRVLMVGNDPSVKGGITSVIGQLLAHDWAADGVSMRFVPTYIAANPVKKILFFEKALHRIRKLLANPTTRPDVVHIHMSYRGSFVRKCQVHKLCRKYDVPDVIHMHGSEFKKWYDGCKPAEQGRIRAMLREVSAVIVLGEQWNDRIKAIEPAAHTVVVSNTVHIPDAVVSWPADARRFQVLFMGMLIDRKGVADLLDAVAKLRDTDRLDGMHVVIVGTGAQEEELKGKAARLGLADGAVEFAGWTAGDKKRELFERSQALVLPSYNEGLPVAVLEAISYGMPVVATNVGDMAAAVHDGENGYLIKPGDVSALADALANIHDRTRYGAFSHASRELAEREFDDAGYFRELGNLYAQVAKESR